MKNLITIITIVSVFILGACAQKDNNQKNTPDTFDTTKEIKVYTRDTASGTREVFMKGIGFKDAIDKNSVLVTGFVEVSGNGDMINKIKTDDYGLGYISLSSLLGSGVKGLSFEGVEASENNVLNGSYKLMRPFNYVLRAEYSDKIKEEISKAYIAYMSTKEGKLVIADNGGIVDMKEEDKSWDDMKEEYTVCSQDNSSTTIRFGGSTSVFKISEKLSADFSPKCGNFVADHNHTGSSDGFKLTQGAKKDDKDAIEIGFASRAFNDSEKGAEGTQGEICLDAVVAIVNIKNTSITDITKEKLKEIFEGTTTTWDDLK